MLARMDRNRFSGLWLRCMGDDRGSEVFDGLQARYEEPHRSYHASGHIDCCLGHFDAASTGMDEPDAVEMALWFHDIIYDVPPQDQDNELRSADLFARLAGNCGEASFRYKVYRLILLTRHFEMPATRDESYMLDIDLAGFGQGWQDFAGDTAKLRAEAHCSGDFSEDRFRAQQVRFMESLHDRASFFHTDFFRKRYEAAAQANVNKYLSMLRSR